MRQLIYLVALFFFAGIGLSSCRSVQYVPVERVKTEIEYKDRLQRDSIHVHDSIFISMKGDTVFRDRWHTEYKDRLVYDTAYVHKIDSIQVPFAVERKLNSWQALKMELGGWALGIVVLIIIILIVRSISGIKKW